MEDVDDMRSFLLAFATALAMATHAHGMGDRGCSQTPAKVYAGAIIGADQLADATATAALRADAETSFYLTSYALTQVPGLSLPAIRAVWAGHPPGIVEVGVDPRNMPDIARSFSSLITPRNGWTWGPTKGAGWPEILARAGWQPRIALLNVFVMGTTGDLADPHYLMNRAAIADVKARARSIRYVLPYLSANSAAITRESGASTWAGAYWATSRALAKLGGGLGLDTPANYFLHVREQAYRDLVVQQIRWANANGLISEVLLSPYDMKALPGTAPQVQFDATFAEAARGESLYLHQHGADPTFYVVTNYSEAPTNEPGRGGGGETIDAVAAWLVRHASVTRWPSGCR